MINAAAEWMVSLGRKEGGWRVHIPGAVSPLCMCACVCVFEGCREEVAKSGPRGGLQSSTPRAWVAFDVARRLWWLRLWRNAARPPSPPKKPPELWNASQAAARPAGMGLEHRRTILPCLLPPLCFPLLAPTLPSGVDNMAATLSRRWWEEEEDVFPTVVIIRLSPPLPFASATKALQVFNQQDTAGVSILDLHFLIEQTWGDGKF